MKFATSMNANLMTTSNQSTQNVVICSKNIIEEKLKVIMSLH